MSENKECLFYIDHNPPECSGTWGGAIYKGACKINSTSCNDTDKCFIKLLYQQVEQKEQEYEELRQYHNKYCEEFEKEKKEWLEKYNQISRGFYNGDYCNTENCSLLKAKEQECERLKEEVSLLKESNSKLQQIEDVNSLEKCYLQQLDQLKAENEELKKNLNEGCLQYLTLMTEQRVLLKTLTEIKEICNSVENIENINSLYDAKLSGMFLQANKILQKISECEVNNDNK